jgi:hypothetical protein
MTQRSVETALGRLATDDELRRLMQSSAEAALLALEAAGLEFSPVERSALARLDARAAERFARTLDPRLQRASLAPPRRSRRS